LWPLLDGERAEQDLQLGDSDAAAQLALTMHRMSWGLGYVPEQAWEDPGDPASPYGSDPTTASIGFSNGSATGSAAPLIWGQAQYLRLLRDVQTGTLVDQPAITLARYVQSGPPAVLPLALDPPQPGAGSAGTTTVSGTTTPDARIVIAAGQPGNATNATSVVSTTANALGRFSASVQTPSGETVITATASSGPHTSGWAEESVTRS
jgi:glucoamylase